MLDKNADIEQQNILVFSICGQSSSATATWHVA